VIAGLYNPPENCLPKLMQKNNESAKSIEVNISLRATEEVLCILFRRLILMYPKRAVPKN